MMHTLSLEERKRVLIGMTNSVWTNTFHYTCVFAEESRPILMRVRGVVHNATVLLAVCVFGMDIRHHLPGACNPFIPGIRCHKLNTGREGKEGCDPKFPNFRFPITGYP